MISRLQRSKDVECPTADQNFGIPDTCQSKMKARQALKIRNLGEALVASGYVSINQQARALGLSRSTTWAIIQADHKTSGLSASVINRILSTPQVPSKVKTLILEYVEEKLAGLYGHNKTQLTRFSSLV